VIDGYQSEKVSSCRRPVATSVCDVVGSVAHKDRDGRYLSAYQHKPGVPIVI
jgi:hypothetical protein